MKILILSPLFPPDTGAPAPYVKALVSHLSADESKLLIYGRLPETVPKVTIIAIDKRGFLVKRLYQYLKVLYQQIKNVDLIIINNGPSIELPFLIVSFFVKCPTIYCQSDPIAANSNSVISNILSTAVKKICTRYIKLPDSNEYLPPEILPFSEIDTKQTELQKLWWEKHLHLIKNI